MTDRLIPGDEVPIKAQRPDGTTIDLVWIVPTPMWADRWMKDFKQLEEMRVRAQKSFDAAAVASEPEGAAYDPVARASALDVAAKHHEMMLACNVGAVVVFFAGCQLKVFLDSHDSLLDLTKAALAELHEVHGVTEGEALQIGLKLFALTQQVIVESMVSRASILKTLDFGRAAPAEDSPTS